MKSLVCLLISLSFTVSLRAQSPQQPATNTVSLDANTFTFRDGGSQVLNLTLSTIGEPVELSWPELPQDEWDTALLRLDIRTSADSALPYIEISSDKRSERQYFRSGDRGLRWLNLSFLRDELSANETVRLSGNGVDFTTSGITTHDIATNDNTTSSVTKNTATLRLFNNDLDLSQTILVLAPHPDDAEIAAFGLYAHRNATIITLTPGNAGPSSYASVFEDPAEMYHFKGKLRLIDSITVPWLGGIPPERTFNMSYFNGRLKKMHDAPDVAVPEVFSSNTDIGAYLPYNLGSLLPIKSRVATWTNLVDDLATVLHKVKPDIIVVPHPQLDSHIDHQYTAVALAEALTRWKTKTDISLLLYTNHADQNRYPYGPAGTLASLPPEPTRDVHLDRIYSHPVSAETQRLKLFALEAMHDLRPSPSRLYQLTQGHDRAQKPESKDPAGGISYLRKGPRSNELFYVYSRATFKPLVKTFLQR